MKKYVVLNNRTFEVVPHLQVNKDYIETIYDAYKRPSKYKIKIWKEWVNWFNELKKDNNDFISICSHNFARFSIHGRVNGYKFYITPTYNYIQLHSLEDVTLN